MPVVLVGYLLARQFAPRKTALWVTAFAAVDLVLIELLVTGALPLLGFALIGLCLWAVMNATFPDIKSLWPILTLVVCVPLLAYTNQTSAGIALIVLPVFAVSLAAFHPCSQVPMRIRLAIIPVTLLPVLAGLWFGGLLALTAWPYYAGVAPGGGALDYPGPVAFLAGPGNANWYLGGFTALAGAWAVWKGRNEALRALGVTELVLTALSVFLSYDESLMNIFFRSGLLAWVLVWPLAGAFVASKRWVWGPRLAPVALAVMAAVSIYQFQDMARYSDQLTPDSEILLGRVGGDGVIVNTFSMSHWVSAVTGRYAPPVWNAKPPEKWQVEDRRVRCILGWTGCGPKEAMESAKALDVQWVLVDTRFPEGNGTSNHGAPPEQWQVTGNAPWLRLEGISGKSMLWYIDSGKEVAYGLPER
jgi:hypothetical protein